MLFYRDTSELKRTHNCNLVFRFAELVRKMWSSKNFKGHVSPHEVLQAVSLASEKRFTIGVQKDPLAFIAWFFNAVSDGIKKNHIRFNRGKTNKLLNSTVIEEAFQGEVEISTLKPKEISNVTGRSRGGIDTQYVMNEETK